MAGSMNLRVYDRALTENEILAIFESGEAGKCKPVTNEELLLDEIAGLDSDVATLHSRISELEEAAAAAAEADCSVEDNTEEETEEENVEVRGHHPWKNYFDQIYDYYKDRMKKGKKYGHHKNRRPWGPKSD